MTQALTPTNGGATGAPTYDPFNYLDPAYATPDAQGELAVSPNIYSVPQTTDFTGATHYGMDDNGVLDVTTPPVIKQVLPAKPVAGGCGTISGTGFFGHVPVLLFQPKTVTGAPPPPIPVPFTVEDDNNICFGPLPANFPANPTGGTWKFFNHRCPVGANGQLVPAGKPVCDPSNVTGYSPTHAAVGATIHILGTFGGPIDTVTYGGGAQDQNAHMSQDGTYVISTVPQGAVNGPLCCYADNTCSGADDCADPSNPFIVDGAPTPGPYISGFQPDSGPAGTHLTIFGQAFTGANKVTIAGQNMASFTVKDDGDITCIIPSGAKSGHLEVFTPAGSAKSATWFNVGPTNDTVPIIDSLTPNPCPQGVSLTIYGSGFVNISPQGGVTFLGSDGRTYFLDANHWKIQTGGTQLVIDGIGTLSLPVMSGHIRITNVAGYYDEHGVQITKFNPKLAVSVKAPFYDARSHTIIAPGSVISTSPPADVVDAPGWLGIVGVVGMVASDLWASGHRPDNAITSPPGTFTAPSIATPGVALPAGHPPHPYTHANKGTVTAHWNAMGKVVRIEDFLAQKDKLMARTIKEEYTGDPGGIYFFLSGPRWHQSRTEILVTAHVVVSSPAVKLVATQIQGAITAFGLPIQTVDVGPILGSKSIGCQQKVYADFVSYPLVAKVTPSPGINWQAENFVAEVDYLDANGHLEQTTRGPLTEAGMDTADAPANGLNQEVFPGCARIDGG